MSSVWDMILQVGSTIKVSIELPVATRHRRDMTEKLLKATLSPNTHTHIASADSGNNCWKKSLRKFRFTNRNTDLIAYKRAKNRFKNVCKLKRLKLEESKR